MIMIIRIGICQMQRFSKKRQAILDFLSSTTSHPTAEWIYLRLKPEYPDLSLATVYRNLIQLKETGLICSVGTVDGHERFDANTTPHPHIVCLYCGKTDDVPNVSIPDSLIESVTNNTSYTVSGAELRFTGICADCMKRSE